MVLACLSGSLYKNITQQAPNCKLELASLTTSSAEDIQKGAVLLGIAYQLPYISKEIYTQKLVDIEGRLFVRQDHPLKKAIVTPQDLAGYEIASLITPGWNDSFSQASRVLDTHSVPHNVGFRSEMILAIIDVLLNSDMYMPHSNLFPIHNYPNLRAIDVDVEDEIKMFSVYSHIHVNKP